MLAPAAGQTPWPRRPRTKPSHPRARGRWAARLRSCTAFFGAAGASAARSDRVGAVSRAAPTRAPHVIHLGQPRNSRSSATVGHITAMTACCRPRFVTYRAAWTGCHRSTSRVCEAPSTLRKCVTSCHGRPGEPSRRCEPGLYPEIEVRRRPRRRRVARRGFLPRAPAVGVGALRRFTRLRPSQRAPGQPGKQHRVAGRERAEPQVVQRQIGEVAHLLLHLTHDAGLACAPVAQQRDSQGRRPTTPGRSARATS